MQPVTSMRHFLPFGPIPVVLMAAVLSGCGTQVLPDGRLATFDTAEVLQSAETDKFELVAKGTKPSPCHFVSLEPLTYFQQPDYWGIQVVLTDTGALCAQVLAPYEVRVSLENTTGTKGVEVIGRTKTKKIDVP